MNEEFDEVRDEDFEAEDSLPEEVVEEPEETGESLESLDEGQPEETEEPVRKEPGYVQGRISKAVDKAVAETEARFKAQLEAMEARYAPLMERMMEMDAQELVRSRKVSDIETARELVRLRNGQTVQAEEPQRPRQANGQFAPQTDASTQARIDMLQHQADRIKEAGGPDVTEAFLNNEDIKKAVVAGDMDFYDVADYLRQEESSRRRPPSPMRSPNGASGKNPNAIDSMSDEMFDRMERKIKEGARYSLR